MEKSIKVKFEKSGVPYGYAYSPGDVCEMPMSKFKELSNKKVVSEMAIKKKPQKPTNETPPKTKQNKYPKISPFKKRGLGGLGNYKQKQINK